MTILFFLKSNDYANIPAPAPYVDQGGAAWIAEENRKFRSEYKLVLHKAAYLKRKHKDEEELLLIGVFDA